MKAIVRPGWTSLSVAVLGVFLTRGVDGLNNGVAKVPGAFPFTILMTEYCSSNDILCFAVLGYNSELSVRLHRALSRLTRLICFICEKAWNFFQV